MWLGHGLYWATIYNHHIKPQILQLDWPRDSQLYIIDDFKHCSQQWHLIMTRVFTAACLYSMYSDSKGLRPNTPSAIWPWWCSSCGLRADNSNRPRWSGSSAGTQAGGIGGGLLLLFPHPNHMLKSQVSRLIPPITEYGGYLARQITAGNEGVYSGS